MAETLVKGGQLPMRREHLVMARIFVELLKYRTHLKQLLQRGRITSRQRRQRGGKTDRLRLCQYLVGLRLRPVPVRQGCPGSQQRDRDQGQGRDRQDLHAPIVARRSPATKGAAPDAS